MRVANCYLPKWTGDGKLLKNGSYVCWEAVIAHATELFAPEPERFYATQKYVNGIVGANVAAAPHWSLCQWLGGDNAHACIFSGKQFLTECAQNTDGVTAVHMRSDGTVTEKLCSQDIIFNKFTALLERPNTLQGPLHQPQSFQTMRKKSRTGHELTVFYWPFKNGLAFNQTASLAFKMQIYGDVIIVQQTKEACFMPRERVVDFNLEQYEAQFSRKRKDAPQVSSNTDFEELTTQLEQVEARASASASMPGDLAKASVIPPPTGAELAKLAAARLGLPPEVKRQKADRAPEVEVAA
jgi:hypothetical protein